jgi:hypothetical protein
MKINCESYFFNSPSELFRKFWFLSGNSVKRAQNFYVDFDTYILKHFRTFEGTFRILQPAVHNTQIFLCGTFKRQIIKKDSCI